MNRFVPLALVLVGLPAWGQLEAETRYVTDILQLGLHRAQDTSDRAFRTLVSGAELEVLERVPNYARVRTADGADGWVKSTYLVAEKPARLRADEAEAALERLRRELAAAKAAGRTAARESAELDARAQATIASANAARDDLARLQNENAAYEARLDLYRRSVPWTWAGAAVGVALIGGFLGGRWWLDAAIRRRYGGFKMY